MSIFANRNKAVFFSRFKLFEQKKIVHEKYTEFLYHRPH